jgi:hypothetical protein
MLCANEAVVANKVSRQASEIVFMIQSLCSQMTMRVTDSTDVIGKVFRAYRWESEPCCGNNAFKLFDVLFRERKGRRVPGTPRRPIKDTP